MKLHPHNHTLCLDLDDLYLAHRVKGDLQVSLDHKEMLGPPETMEHLDRTAHRDPQGAQGGPVPRENLAAMAFRVMLDPPAPRGQTETPVELDPLEPRDSQARQEDPDPSDHL